VHFLWIFLGLPPLFPPRLRVRLNFFPSPTPGPKPAARNAKTTKDRHVFVGVIMASIQLGEGGAQLDPRHSRGGRELPTPCRQTPVGTSTSTCPRVGAVRVVERVVNGRSGALNPRRLDPHLHRRHALCQRKSRPWRHVHLLVNHLCGRSLWFNSQLVPGCFFLPGGLLHKQGPRRARRLRGNFAALRSRARVAFPPPPPTPSLGPLRHTHPHNQGGRRKELARSCRCGGDGTTHAHSCSPTTRRHPGNLT
jgi:hypothetical protein